MIAHDHGRNQAAMQECLRLQSEADAPGPLASLLGRSPLHHDVAPLYRSALGDAVVSSELALLGDEWSVLGAHGEDQRALGVAHLLIGPSGVFAVVTSCQPSARVIASAESVRVNGRRSEVREQAKRIAEDASRLLSTIAGTTVVVTPIVAIAAASMVTSTPGAPGVEVVSVKRLVRSLTVRPRAVKPAAIEGLTTMAIESLAWTPLDFVRSDDAERRALRFERLHAEVEAARGRRRAWRFAGVALAASCGVLAAIVGVQVLVSGLSAVAAG